MKTKSIVDAVVEQNIDEYGFDKIKNDLKSEYGKRGIRYTTKQFTNTLDAVLYNLSRIQSRQKIVHIDK